MNRRSTGRQIGASRNRSGDFKDLAELGNYVTGRTMLTTVTVPQVPYGLALAEVTGMPVDCSSFDGRTWRVEAIPTGANRPCSS